MDGYETQLMNDELHALLGEVRRRWLAVIGARTFGRALIAAAGPLALGVAIDLLFAPRNVLLLLLGVGAVVGSAAAAATVLWRSRRRPDDRQLARFIEEQVAREPSEAPLDDALVSAVDAANGADPFARLVVASAVTRLRAIPATTIVPRPAMNRAIGEAIGGIAAFALVAIAARGPSARVFDTAQVMLFPGTLHVTVLPGNTRVAAGHPLRIRATIRGADAVLQRITPALTVTSGAGQRTVAMARSGDGFEFAFESVDRSFKYRVKAGAATSEEYAVTALFAPRVQRIDLRYVYPSFAGLSPHEESGSGDIYAPAGTRVHLAVHTDRPAEGGDLAFGHLPAAGLRLTSDRLLEGDIVLSQEDSYRVRLSSPEGLRSGGDTEYFIRLVDDRPPDVRILRPAGDQKITPLEEVTIEARADDDYGLSRFELVYSVAGRPGRVVPFTRVTGTAVEKVGTHLLAAEDLHVQPGDVVTYYARARDVARGKQSTEAKSDIFFLEVKPFNAEFAAAESQAGGGASGTQIDALVAAQKEIINATWNLERRSSAGRSAADLAAVAQAQAQLKQRAEQMGGAGGRQQPGMPRPPQQIAPRRERPDAGGDPVGAAVAAMGRALQQLQAQHAKDAIPHEMAALQGLLQAQAEVRRRQVTQQQAGSGAGSGRQGEDLSALFDKELQRQQRTNYETRSHVENPPEKQDRGDAADRVRDLARRQEDLSQRQRDLARSGLSEEERRRQLEKLTREQNELRSELEQLARREGEQGASRRQGQRGSGEQRQGQSGQQGSASSRAAGGMRGASEQMRAATDDLQRQDPNAAAGNGQRAAEQLRQLEQDMRGGGAAGRQRAAGELQLEAQQLADEQRRIAAEAERLGASGRGADEARRRLAADKERLAGRVDQLQRSAKQAGSAAGKDTAAQGAADAARELERQRVAERMRETARSLRAGPGRAEGAGQQASAERQLARTMQGVVDKLSGEGGADARRLAGELDQTRQVRERLNDLERRIRDAQGRGDDSGRGNEQLQQLRDEYARGLQRARQAFAPNGQGDQRTGAGASTPEQQEYSRSAPGTEAFKQDFSKWESLRKEIDLALEKHDAAVSARLARKLGADRLSGGGSERVPEAYRAMIAKYYESLAKVK